MNDTPINMVVENIPKGLQKLIKRKALPITSLGICLNYFQIEKSSKTIGYTSLLVTSLTISLYTERWQYCKRVNIDKAFRLGNFMRNNLLLLLYLSLIVFCGCKGNKEAAPEVIPEVNVVTAVQRDVPVYAEYVG